VLSKIALDATPGNDQLVLAGSFVLSTGSFATLDPAVTGPRLLVHDQAGALQLDAQISNGTYAGKGTRGWTRNKQGTKWTFTDKTAAPVSGIVKATLVDQNKKVAGRIGVKLSGKNGTYPFVVGDQPLLAHLALGASGAPCAVTGFDAGSCTFNRPQTKLGCKK